MPDWSLVFNLFSLVSIFTVICNVIGRYQRNNRGVKQWILCTVYVAFVVVAKLQFPQGYSDFMICLLSWFAVGYLDYFFGTRKHPKGKEVPLQDIQPTYEQKKWEQSPSFNERIDEATTPVDVKVEPNVKPKTAQNRPGSSPGKGPTFQTRTQPVELSLDVDESTRQSIYRRALTNPAVGGEYNENDVC